MKHTEKPKYSVRQNVCFMVRTAWETRRRVLLLCVVLAAVQVALNLAQLYIAPEILAKVEQGATVRELVQTIGFFTAVLFLLQGAAAYCEAVRMPGEIDVRCAVIRMISRKNGETSYPNVHDSKILKLEEQTQRATSGNDDAAEHIWHTLTELLANLGGFAVYLLLLCRLSRFLILLVVLTAAADFFVSHYIGEWEYRHRDERERYDKELHYFLDKPRQVQLAKEIRVFGLAPWLRELREKSLRALAAFITRREKTCLWANAADVVLTLMRNGIAYAYLIRQTLVQGWPASTFLLYFTAVSGAAAWVTGILTQCSQLHKESIDLSRVQEYLHIPEPFRFAGGLQPPAADGYELRLENVSFRYPGTEKDILKQMNLTIRPGERLAVVGLNGAGKTTMVMLLCGFYDPTEGRVLLNGQDIREFDRSAYYRLFSAVFQGFSILDTTIAECVAQTAENIDREKVERCLAQAGLTQAIAQFPQGINTHFGRDVYLDGVQLSGGQTQRLMLARALYKDGPILILDEPTAALDPIAENDIYQKYSDMTAGKTSVFISHRLASTRFCDRILFIAGGGIAEEGTHQELLAKGGAYAELFAVQSRYYQEGGVQDAEEG